VRKAAASETPIIDISPIFSQDSAARQTVAREIHKAAYNNGFFYIKHQGIPAEVYPLGILCLSELFPSRHED
jgi:isopenicillin N synthase-like dioxygenase